MSKSINDILAGKEFETPREVQIIKEYVTRNFDSECNIKMSPTHIVIQVDNSALAGSLQLKIEPLKEQLATDKKILIRTI